MSTQACKVLKDAKGDPTGQIVTPRAMMIYPSLFEASLPKGETDAKKAKYQATMIFHKSVDLMPLAEQVKQTLSEKLTPQALANTKVKKPFIKITQEDQPKVFNKLVAAGLDPADWPVMLRASNAYRPPVKNPDMSDCLDEEQTYDGRFCRANVNFFFYDHPTGGKGVSTGLNSVQLLDAGTHLPRSGGGASTGDEFEAVDVGGVASGGSADSVFN